jgi:hypothetical protein
LSAVLIRAAGKELLQPLKDLCSGGFREPAEVAGEPDQYTGEQRPPSG